MSVLVTGGLGYIGSHTVVSLIEDKYDVVLVDNLVNSKKEVLNRIETITKVRPNFYEYDLRDKEKLELIFKENNIDSVIHFAGLKAVGESVSKPIMYYNNNLESTISLLEVMNEYNCKNIIFSSSATVYGPSDDVPYKETQKLLDATNPYGRTKRMIEDILKDLYVSDNKWNIVLLRYFNPIGAHKSGLLGEDPNGIPNNLMPYITQVAIGKRERLNVFGNDYNTHDGTGVRDYIHVLDLAYGHLCALKHIEENEKKGESKLDIYNLGTGIGYSVLDIVSTFEKVNNIKVPYVIAPRRSGDIAICYACNDKAKKEIGFQCKYGLDDMCKDSYNFQVKNPRGIE